MPITSPGRAHLRAEHGIDAGELVEREHRFLHRHEGRHDLLGEPDVLSVSPHITRAAYDASGTPIAFETKGIVRLARGFTSST